MFGEREVSTFVNRGDEYPVIMRARAQDRATPSDLTNTFVRATNGSLIPLSSFITLSESAAPQALNRFDRLRSITIQSALAPGVSIGEGLEALEQIVQDNLPAEARIGYSGQSRDFRDSSSAIYVTFGMALLVVFLVLAAQFESWINPFIIMLTVPLAVTGGLAALALTGQTLNIYSQIGMILLIGLMTKNGILIVEFSNQLRERGYSVRDAVIEASVHAPAADPDDLDRDDRRRYPARLVGRRRRRGAQRHRLGDRRRRDGLDAADHARGAVDLPADRRLHQARHVCRRTARQAARANRIATARRSRQAEREHRRKWPQDSSGRVSRSARINRKGSARRSETRARSSDPDEWPPRGRNRCR